MKSEILSAAGAILSRVASIGDGLVGHVQALAQACERASLRQGRGVDCPYCLERIYTVKDHAAFCDVAESLKAPLAAPDASWPVVRYGVSISHELAEALTRRSE